MKRAANQMGDGFAVQTAAAVGDRESDRPAKSEKILGSKAPPEAKMPEKHVEKQPDKAAEKSKMTRFSNGVAPAVNGNGSTSNGHTAAPRAGAPVQAVQQLQIVRLLQDLGERLRQSEKEREILWKELDGCRKLLTDIEDKTSKTEKAYLQLEHKVSSGPSADAQAETEASQ